MRIERQPCPRCNSPLTSAPKQNYLANGSVRLISVCSKCHLSFTVGVTNRNLMLLEKLYANTVKKFEKETEWYGSPRTSTKIALKEVEEKIRKEKQDLGVST